LFYTPTTPHCHSSTCTQPPLYAPPQQPHPFPSPSPHAYLSNHYTTGTGCRVVSFGFQHDTSADVRTIPCSSSVSPCSASAKIATNFTFAINPTSTASPLLMANSSFTLSISLNLVVDFSSYPLQQGTALPPSSHASPPLVSRHPMVL